jgi:hypothetical protein
MRSIAVPVALSHPEAPDVSGPRHRSASPTLPAELPPLHPYTAALTELPLSHMTWIATSHHHE